MQVDGADETCPLCCELLFKPAVLPCGHVFCKGCIGGMETHTLSGSNAKCPICRRVLPGVEDLAECQYARRRAEHEQRIHDTEVLPIFVLDTVLPEQILSLRIFEPRYKLMLQRALASGGKARFGMVGHDPDTGSLLSRGTEMVVTECLGRNGCYFIETAAHRIFEICERWMKDEYLCARVMWEDASEGPRCSTHSETHSSANSATQDTEVQFGGSSSPTSTRDVPADAEAKAKRRTSLLAKLREWEGAVVDGGCIPPSRLAEIKSQLGSFPAAAGDNAQAMWLGAFLNPLPSPGVVPDIRHALLSANTAADRLDLVEQALDDSLQHLTINT